MEGKSPGQVIDNKTATDKESINVDEAFKSIAQNTSANSVYSSMIKKNVYTKALQRNQTKR